MKSDKVDGGAKCFMFVVIVLVTMMFIGAFTSGCGVAANTMKHMKSSFVGLNRHIALYASDGKIIREWDTTAKVEDAGGTCYFIDKNGKAVTIAGTFIIEEK